MGDRLPLPWPASIIAPVSRRLPVRDPSRSVAFYRDVLGFRVQDGADAGESLEAEVVHGPARIRFFRDAAPADGRRVVFFATDEVDGMRAAVLDHGGAPTPVEDVNGIKLRVFQVQDPDGHTLWFGQSFDEQDPPRPEGQLTTIMPELPLDDLPAGVAYYRDVLGFAVNYEQHDIAVMDRDEVRVLLIARTERHTGIGSCYLYVRPVDALHAELLERGAHVQGAPVSQPWGLREFQVLDGEGNRLSFAQTFE